MYKRFAVVAVAVVLSLGTSTLLAQCGCGFAPTTYSPTIAYYAPAPQVTCYAPATPRVTYYAPVAQTQVAYCTPAAQSCVTSYAPAAQPVVAYYGVAGVSIYGTPKVYVPGEPVRNVLRAITP